MAGLPADVSRFVGRRAEIEQVRRLLAGSRLVTLTGPGGVGKTRLALETARTLERAFPDRSRFVDLSVVEDPGMVANAVAAALDVPDTARADVTVVLAATLADARALIVIDNCEHVVAAVAALVEPLLFSAPGVRFLVTSRETLGVMGEQVLPVPPMAVPEGPPTLGEALQSDALALFVERASAHLPNFELTEENYDVVVQLCSRLEGLPLAIELAAARVRALSFGQILARLDAPFELLTGRRRAVPARHQTLQATVAWSFDLCSEPERMLWTRLAVFSGSFDIEGAESLAGGDVLHTLASLMDKSVLLREPGATRTRYRMLETIRTFGRARLADRGEESAVRRRHRDHFLGLARHVDASWLGPDQADRLDRFRLDLPDVEAALAFSLGEPDEAGRGDELACALWWFWITRGIREGRHWLDRALSVDGAASTRARRINGWLALAHGDGTGASRLLGGPPDGVTVLREAARDRRESGSFDADSSLAWCNLPTVAALIGDPDRAEELCQDWVVMCESADEAWARSWALWVLAILRWRRGETAASEADAIESVALKRSLGDQLGTPPALALLARIATAGGDPERGALLFGAAESLWEPLGRPPFGWGTFRDWAEQWRTESVDALGERAFAAAYVAGRVMDLDEALALAVGEKAPVPSGAAAPVEPPLLTRRESEVARLIAEGRSNKEIAEALVISQRTAEAHVAHILRKLGFSSRAQVAAWISRL